MPAQRGVAEDRRDGSGSLAAEQCGWDAESESRVSLDSTADAVTSSRCGDPRTTQLWHQRGGERGRLPRFPRQRCRMPLCWVPAHGSVGYRVASTTYACRMPQTIDPAVVEQVNDLADRARVASRRLALLSRAEKDAALPARGCPRGSDPGHPRGQRRATSSAVVPRDGRGTAGPAPPRRGTRGGRGPGAARRRGAPGPGR